MTRLPVFRAPLAAGLAIAICAGQADAVAIAPCYFQMPGQAATNQIEVQVTPTGEFLPRDGRKLPVGAWRIDAAIAAQVIERFRANKTPLVLDYEHQTLQAEDNGHPAPAAGFFRDLQWRDGMGLVATIELTERALGYVRSGEYRYFSPVFAYDKRTGEVTELLMGALTNNPALDGMAPVELRAAARFHLNTTEEPAMNKHLLAIALACAIATTNQTEDQVGEAVLKKVKELDTSGGLVALRKELGLADDVGAEEINTAVVALKNKAAATTTGDPDPAKFVPIGVVDEMRVSLAALTATNTQRAVDDLVKPALEDGRLLSAQEKWARDLGASNIAALKTYLDGAQPIAALRGSQTDGQDPTGGKSADGLTNAELAVCKATGVDPAAFAKARPTTVAA